MKKFDNWFEELTYLVNKSGGNNHLLDQNYSDWTVSEKEQLLALLKSENTK